MQPPQRVAADPSGKVLLPVGSVAAAELACVLRALDRTTELKKRPLKAQAALNVFAAEAGFENSLLGDQYCTGSNAASDQDGYSTKAEAKVDSL
jgi:hypothetical protein